MAKLVIGLIVVALLAFASTAAPLKLRHALKRHALATSNSAVADVSSSGEDADEAEHATGKGFFKCTVNNIAVWVLSKTNPDPVNRHMLAKVKFRNYCCDACPAAIIGKPYCTGCEQRALLMPCTGKAYKCCHAEVSPLDPVGESILCYSVVSLGGPEDHDVDP